MRDVEQFEGSPLLILVNAGMYWAGWIWFAQMVARSASRLVKLCTGLTTVGVGTSYSSL
jgi:hypothetical protein